MSKEDQNYFLPYAFINDIENDNEDIHQYSDYDEKQKEDIYEENGNNENVNIGSETETVVNNFNIQNRNKRINKRHKMEKNIKKIKKDLIFNKSHKEAFENNDEEEEEETDKCFNNLDKEYLIYGIIVGILVIFIANVIYKIK